MAKEKTEFEILANTLKAMNKQCTAKVKENRAALTAIFVSFKTQLAYACTYFPWISRQSRFDDYRKTGDVQNANHHRL